MQHIPQHDRDLVAFALEGSQYAYSLLMLRHKGALKSYIQHHFSLGDEAEELILVIFGKAFSKLDSYNPRFSFSTWLHAIAENACIDFVRKQRSGALIFRSLSQPFDSHSTEDIPDLSNPETELIAAQQSALLLTHIDRLTPIYREPARLRFLNGYAYEEIAQTLSIPKSTVKIRIHRAKELLSKWIINS
ncbi:MAG: RNA polymerase sigma factor [Prevotellaceae bacterium]|jgi:RNA polymerase sigma-70 factor (ECF subfamily)|nr:RNA polymerase sigma factor [Prevotellaceae bacterium]